MSERKATRDGFGEAMSRLGKLPYVFVLDADLSESTRSAKFKEKCPERFFNMGIAEQDMVATAAGIASCDKCVFACSFAVFVTGNAYAQIRLHAGISKLNIKLVGSHAGILTGEDGASHQALEDISLMRGIPGMRVIVPSDSIEAEKATEYLAKMKGPAYLRLGRGKVTTTHSRDYQFNPQKIDLIKPGKDITIFCTGSMVEKAVEVEKMLQSRSVSAEIINVHTIKPIDKEGITYSSRKTKKIVTLEDHSVFGGLGTAVEEVLCESFPLNVFKIGMNDCFGESGTPSELYHKFGLDSQGIFDKIVSKFNF